MFSVLSSGARYAIWLAQIAQLTEVSQFINSHSNFQSKSRVPIIEKVEKLHKYFQLCSASNTNKQIAKSLGSTFFEILQLQVPQIPNLLPNSQTTRLISTNRSLQISTSQNPFLIHYKPANYSYTHTTYRMVQQKLHPTLTPIHHGVRGEKTRISAANSNATTKAKAKSERIAQRDPSKQNLLASGFKTNQKMLF